jgi:hypothetical protein
VADERAREPIQPGFGASVTIACAIFGQRRRTSSVWAALPSRPVSS